VRGRTPLMAAVASGNLATVEALLAAGASAYSEDHQGLKPEDFAANLKYSTERGPPARSRFDGGRDEAA